MDSLVSFSAPLLRVVGDDPARVDRALTLGAALLNMGWFPEHRDRDKQLNELVQMAAGNEAERQQLHAAAAEMLGTDFAKGLIYAALVVLLGLLYWVQQRMVASRAAVSPTMSPAQQKLMQYLPVAFAVFQVFFLLGLVVYYLVQTVLRIGQQYYITKRFYSGEESLGRQAQAASARARELAKAEGNGSQAPTKRDQADARKPGKNQQPAAASGPAPTKRTTPPKNRPTSTARQAANRPGGSRSGSKKRNG